jgi:hypothetical protein
MYLGKMFLKCKRCRIHINSLCKNRLKVNNSPKTHPLFAKPNVTTFIGQRFEPHRSVEIYMMILIKMMVASKKSNKSDSGVCEMK